MPVFAQASPELIDACGESSRSYACEKVFEWTDSELLARSADWLVERPLRVLIVIVLAFVVNRLARRAIDRFADGLAEARTDERFRALQERGPGWLRIEQAATARASARADTIGRVLRSVVSSAIVSIALLTILGEVGINLAPLIAGAGIAGIALGFGAQTVVRDFLSGMFMLIEDQYGVGDVIDVGEAHGTVEDVSLRTTTIRDVQGTLWHVPNGEIHRVANFSQLWSRAVIDVEVAYDADLRLAEGVVQRVADELWRDPEWGGEEIVDQPEVWGVQNLGADGVAIRLVVKTEPSQQWKVERELRLRVKEALDEAGIEIPFPQRTVWIRNEGEHPRPERPDPSTISTVPARRPGGDDVASSDPAR